MRYRTLFDAGSEQWAIVAPHAVRGGTAGQWPRCYPAASIIE